MAYFLSPRGALPARFAPKGVRLRVDNGGTYLGSLTTFIQSRYPSYNPTPTTTTPTTTTPTTTIRLTSPTVSPAPTPSPVPIPTTFFSPTPAPTTTPTSAPPPPPPSYTPTPAPQPDPFGAAQGSGGVDAGAVAQAAAPIVGAISPAAGAAAALLPAFTDAASQPETSQIRFSGGGPDLSLPEVYNPDGTPVTATAKAATFADKIKALPPAAKIGGAVALYLLLGR